VGGHDDGLVLGHLGDEFAHVMLLIGIEAIRRLVHDEDLGIVQDGLRHPDPAFVALRQRIDLLFEHRLEGGSFHGAVDASIGLRAVKTSDLRDKLQKAPRRHVAIGRGALGHVAHFGFRRDRLIGNGDAADPGAAGIGFEEAGEHFHGRRFAGAVGAEKAQHFALCDLERDAIDRIDRAKALAQIARLDQDRHQLLSPKCCGPQPHVSIRRPQFGR
jgi:hypothetical protein